MNRDWEVQVRSMRTWGSWESVHPQSFGFGWPHYWEDVYLNINGRRYDFPWRVLVDGRIVAQSDGRYIQRSVA